MPSFLNWLLRLIPTNPICMRLVQGGSRRVRHMYIRAGYLALMIIVLLFVLLNAVSGGQLSLRQLASAGAAMFENVSYLQVVLICLLTPVFMAGAIAQEANPRTWDILLTTPMNNLQIVLGNLFGRLFFVLALLFSSLPLFVVTQYFGGVPGASIFASYAIAGTSALIVAAIAVTLSVTRTAGRRAVFLFYASVVMYLFVTYAIDLQLRTPAASGAVAAMHTTVVTPLNPFLALEVLLNTNLYVPHDFTGRDVSWIQEMWFASPIATFCWLCTIISLFLAGFSTLRLRVIGAKTGTVPWHRRLLRLGAKDAPVRPARTVGKNPIAWRESAGRGKTLGAIVARWGFVAVGVTVALAVIGLHRIGNFDHGAFRLAIASVVAGEIVIIALASLNMSATAVSREREDGTLDIILTTPIQPGPYIRGKHRGLFQYLIPMMAVPTATLLLVAIYVLTGGLGHPDGVVIQQAAIANSTNRTDVPIVLPEAAVVVPLVLGPFIAFCVMVGLQWSIKSKGTIGSVIASVGVVLAVAGVITLCGIPSGEQLHVLGAVIAVLSPINALFAVVYPETTISDAVDSGLAGARVSVMVGAVIAALGYGAVSYGMHTSMKRTFMQTVRRLSGTS